jgi:uncharacterized protein YraI
MNLPRLPRTLYVLPVLFLALIGFLGYGMYTNKEVRFVSQSQTPNQNNTIEVKLPVAGVGASTPTPINEVSGSPNLLDPGTELQGNEVPALEPVPEIKIEEKKLYTYIEVIDSCDAHFGGACVRVRSGPGTEYSQVSGLRNGVVLKSSGIVEANGRKWYKIVFDEWIRYPERVTTDWYVSADFVKEFKLAGAEEYVEGVTPATNKKIIVDRSEQKLYAYEDDTLFMEQSVSTGLPDMPTPRGTFKIFKKLPSRYMQGPLPGISDDYYDLPGVPWTMYFTEQGGAFHGAYWHNNFGRQWSHGCVNLPGDKAEQLYLWADLGTTVVVRD